MSDSIKSNELCDEICLRLSKGEPLRHICNDSHMPQYRTVYDWMYSDEEFAANIARAREIGSDAIADECIEIADDSTNDTVIETFGDNVVERENKEWVNRSKLRVETRLKLLAKWNPKKYGEKITHDGTINIEQPLFPDVHTNDSNK